MGKFWNLERAGTSDFEEKVQWVVFEVLGEGLDRAV